MSTRRQHSPSSARARRAALQLIAPPPRPARPPYIPSRQVRRRPGERREPLALPGLPRDFVAVAKAYGVELGCAIELALERALVAHDLDAIDRSLYRRVIDATSASAMTAALPPVKARYLRVLLAAAARGLASGSDSADAATVVVDVPLRLFPRVLAIAPSAELTAAALAEALRLEIAAVSDGRTMSEWAALAALRLTR